MTGDDRRIKFVRSLRKNVAAARCIRKPLQKRLRALIEGNAADSAAETAPDGLAALLKRAFFARKQAFSAIAGALMPALPATNVGEPSTGWPGRTGCATAGCSCWIHLAPGAAVSWVLSSQLRGDASLVAWEPTLYAECPYPNWPPRNPGRFTLLRKCRPPQRHARLLAQRDKRQPCNLKLKASLPSSSPRCARVFRHRASHSARSLRSPCIPCVCVT